MRKKFELTPAELGQFNWLKPLPGEAISFWRKIAKDRGIDPRSIISNAPLFTALPLGHGKHFCFPLALACKKKPVYAEA